MRCNSAGVAEIFGFWIKTFVLRSTSALFTGTLTNPPYQKCKAHRPNIHLLYQLNMKTDVAFRASPNEVGSLPKFILSLSQ